MANWNDLKASVAEVIKTNGNQEITGQILQNVLNSIISNVGENSTFAGVATPSTDPGTPDGNVFYFAIQAGTYANFSGAELKAGLNMLLWNGNSWSVINVSEYLDNKLIKLYAFTSSVGGLLEIGQIGYSTTNKALYKKETESRVSTVPFIDGAIYTYNNELYIWNGSDLIKTTEQTDAQLTLLDNELNMLSNMLSYLNDNGAYNRFISNIIWESGYYDSNGTIQPQNYHTVIELNENDKYLLTNARSLSSLYSVFFNESGGIISTFHTNNELPTQIEIPSGAKKVGISNFNTNPNSSVYIILNPKSINSIKDEITNEFDVKLEDKLDKIYEDYIVSNKLNSTYVSSSGYRTYTFDLTSVDAIVIDPITAAEGYPTIRIYFSDNNNNVIGEEININTGFYEGGNFHKPSGATKINIYVYYSTATPVIYAANINEINIIETLKDVSENVDNYTFSILDYIDVTYTSSGGYRSYTINTNGIEAIYINKCTFTDSNTTISYYDSSDILLKSESITELEGYLSLPSGCAYVILRCYYTSTVGKVYSATKFENSPKESIIQNFDNINKINSELNNLGILFHQYDDGAYYTFSDKTVGEDQNGKPYDLGTAGNLMANGMPNIIVKEGGYIDGSDLSGGSFYLTLKMKKRCTYCASTIICAGQSGNINDGVLIISDEKSRDGITSQFHCRILHILLPNITKSSVFSIQLGDYDKYTEEGKRWNYEYTETTIVEIYSDISVDTSLTGEKLLWEVYVEDEILYIFLNNKLVKVYKNVSSENEAVNNFAFSDLIPNADRAEVEDCKVIDFCIGTQKFTYDMYVSLYNAKKLLGL